MSFWARWFKKEKPNVDSAQPGANDRELIKQWLQSINDSLIGIKEELQKIPSQTVATLNESFVDRNDEILRQLDGIPQKINDPLKEIIGVTKQEIVAELIRISSRDGSHYSHDSVSAKAQIEKPIQEITKDLTGKQKRLLAILLDSGFLSYAEIGEKLGITHESAKNLVNRLLKDTNKAKLFSKQQTDQGIKVSVSNEIQDEMLRKKYRTTSNDST